jgi:23S rRNA pseudouridine2605 synthase
LQNVLSDILDSAIRVQKWFSQIGYMSRRRAEKCISNGEILINGKVLKNLGTKIKPSQDIVVFKNKIIENKYPDKIYLIFHKPDKTLSSHKPQNNLKTIFDLPSLKKINFHIFSVGRLDYRTEGMMILTK